MTMTKTTRIGRRRTGLISIEAEVEVDLTEHLSEIPTSDLVDELESRAKHEAKPIANIGCLIPIEHLADRLRDILHEVRMGRSADAQRLLADLIEETFRVQQIIARNLQQGRLDEIHGRG